MGRRTFLIMTGATLVIASAVPVQNQVREREVRTFPQFVGTWVLDRAASTGRMNMAPPPPVTLTIATTPVDVVVTKVFDLPPELPGREGRRMATNNPPPEVYQINGTPTIQHEGGTEIQQSFALVADALALTRKRLGRGAGPAGPFTAVTDALSVDGDVLTLHRQLTSVNEAGQIWVMQEPTNNFRHTYIYRRAPRAPN